MALTAIGGLWVLFKFVVLKEINKAATDLQLATIGVEKSAAEYDKLVRELKERGTLNVKIKADALRDGTSGLPYLAVHALLNNTGNRDELFRCTRQKLRSRK